LLVSGVEEQPAKIKTNKTVEKHLIVRCASFGSGAKAPRWLKPALLLLSAVAGGRVNIRGMRLEGRTSIVTGASRGIGRAIALKLAAEGSRAVLCARDERALGEAAGEIRKAGGEADAMALDLRAPDAAARLTGFALARYGSIDVLVNNAGATKRGEFLELTDDDFADGFALKFFGAVRLTRVAWPHLKAAAGSVVFISGAGGRTPGAQFTIGGPVNAALLSLTKALADLGIRDGVQVNAINPGSIRTARYTARLKALAAERGLTPEAAERAYVQNAHITRIGEPEEIAALVAFMASAEGRLLQGSLVDMDGGATKTV
jgi:3-oxoacyl-[acyl-carrier protein] reductase